MDRIDEAEAAKGALEKFDAQVERLKNDLINLGKCLETHGWDGVTLQDGEEPEGAGVTRIKPDCPPIPSSAFQDAYATILRRAALVQRRDAAVSALPPGFRG